MMPIVQDTILIYRNWTFGHHDQCQPKVCLVWNCEVFEQPHHSFTMLSHYCFWSQILKSEQSVLALISECSSYQVIDDATRSRGYQTNNPTCDNSLATKWYRFQGASGTRMATSCVTKSRCGTHAPGWLSGSHPTVAQGIQSVKVCFHWSSNCCQWSTNIRVRNCGGFFVYELKKPPACHLRYCGNSGSMQVFVI